MGWNKLWNFLKNNVEYMNNCGIKFTFQDISWGNRYYNGYGELCILNLFNSVYQVGYEDVTQDDDNWAQAECNREDFCIKIVDDISSDVEPEFILSLLVNYKQKIREDNLSLILEK